MYSAVPLRTNLHANYSRVFVTPYNENLIVASSNGPGSVSASLGAANAAVLNTGHRNQFNVGLETSLSLFSLSGEYLWKFTYGAYDFDVLLNSPLTFPTQFRKSKIDGALVRLTLNPAHGMNGFSPSAMFVRGCLGRRWGASASARPTAMWRGPTTMRAWR